MSFKLFNIMEEIIKEYREHDEKMDHIQKKYNITDKKFTKLCKRALKLWYETRKAM